LTAVSSLRRAAWWQLNRFEDNLKITNTTEVTFLLQGDENHGYFGFKKNGCPRCCVAQTFAGQT